MRQREHDVQEHYFEAEPHQPLYNCLGAYVLSSKRRHNKVLNVTGVQTCALPSYRNPSPVDMDYISVEGICRSLERAVEAGQLIDSGDRKSDV